VARYSLRMAAAQTQYDARLAALLVGQLARRMPLAENSDMPLTRIEHYLVISDDLEATKRFYCDALGLLDGPRPPFAFRGLWLYAGDTACIHVAERTSYAASREGTDKKLPLDAPTTGAIDHIAFAAEDYDGVLARLEQHAITVRKAGVPGRPLRQLFVLDPDGVQIEMNFRTPA
jgi:catechol 2,3-dioxygenase-like lactoylglutathione lyase family enzyme